VKTRLRARFRVLAMAQVAAILGTCIALAFALRNGTLPAVSAVLGLLLALQVFALLRSVESHIDDLEAFFAAIDFDDFTRRFVADDVDAELKNAFNAVLERFADARAQRDLQAQYLETVVRHVPVPLLAVRDDGAIRLINQPARRLLGIPTVRALSDLATLDEQLPARLEAIAPGQQTLLQTRLRSMPVELRVAVAEIRLEGRAERLYSLENLSGELTARESTAWRNLIRVLTHEIMNTLTPVTSLAQTTVALIDDPRGIDDVREAVQTIARRSAGLTGFVSRYRELLQVPQPRPKTVKLESAVRATLTLLGDALADITTSVTITPPSLSVSADPDLLDQVLLNLLKNATDALRGHHGAALYVDAALEQSQVHLTIRDNGPGIAADILEQVFVPFYTTKHDGSGIGLSLCRQIMTAHGGAISMDSSADGTTVRLVF
jgi:nitrogen fixation/metabolism regulation signal transduction histidine kinase